MSRHISGFTEDEILKVIKAYLVDGLSHRKIQWEILGLPAPDNGGGYIAMDILHYYNIDGTKKKILKNKSIDELITTSQGKFKESLIKLKAYLSEEVKVEKIIEGIGIIQPENTEISVMTKQRVGQDKLRSYILEAYNHECALCEINKHDLLICSHIIPWRIDEKNRLNPKNAICLCILHDKLFDKGYFSLNNKYEIVYTVKTDVMVKSFLKDLSFKIPLKSLPDKELLKQHSILFSN